jgi:hypothetical protein
VQPPSPGPGGNILLGVAVLSACDAWAVGSDASGGVRQTLTEHWDGRHWRQVPSPSPGGPGTDSELFSVAATSAHNAWAAGENFTGTRTSTLILHWNGTRWARAASPSPGHSNELFGVGATSAGNAWAVGLATNCTANQTLILHWNGRRWRHVASPSQGGSATSNQLDAVTATSTRSAWAVGSFDTGTARSTLILHWNGTRWIHVRSPNPGTFSSLLGVAARSASNIWAVGSFSPLGPPRPSRCTAAKEHQ